MQLGGVVYSQVPASCLIDVDVSVIEPSLLVRVMSDGDLTFAL